MPGSATGKSVVVGVDGSKPAMRAALWAVDEAVSRAAPLRLLYAVEPGSAQSTGQLTVRQALATIEAAGKPVDIETDIVPGPAIGSLLRASGSAAMVCVGAVGLRHFQPGRVGSTAAALAISARCPVAIIRGRDGRRRPADGILVEVDDSPDNGVLLGAAIEEALLRGAALRAVICRRPGDGGIANTADTDGDRRALADLDRRLARWKRGYPQLRVEAAAVHGSLLEYLAYQHRSVDLLIVGAHNQQRVAELVGRVGSSVLQDADCSLLIVNRQHL
jgi:nucleotide-binding universal stress UspA family protein